jgi:hypothetical protein
MIRNFNFQNNQRLDIPHMKMIESSITHDLQVLAGNIISGNKPIIVKGFTIPVTNVIGNPATSLQMITADSVLIHPLGSEEGSLFTVPSTQPTERLNTNNSKVIGSFASNATNYIGIDLIRVVDTTNSNTVSILSDTTNEEYTQIVSLQKVLDYRIYIQTANFDSTSNICPVAIVVVDSLGNVTSVTDARPLAFRLGVGGTSPSATTPYYSLPDRTEAPVSYTGTGSSPFTGGDKNITSFRDWMAVVENRIWEGSGGAYWYSPSSVNDIRPAYDTSVMFPQSSGNWYWNAGNLLWQGLRFIFSNGINDAYYCTVADQTAVSTGLTDLDNGECLYIDIDRSQNVINSPVYKTNFAAMPQPTIPGSRLIIAWKNFDEVYTYGESAPVNSTTLQPASTTSFGAVKIYSFSSDRTEPVCPIVNLSGRIIGNGLCNPGPTSEVLNIGTGSYDSLVNIGHSGIYTTVFGTLQCENVVGGITSGGNLSLLSTIHPTKGYIYLGSSGESYFDEQSTILQVPTLIGTTLYPIPNTARGKVFLGDSGLSYIDAENSKLITPTVRGSDASGRDLLISSEVEGGAPQPVVYLGSAQTCYFDEINGILHMPVLRGSSNSGGNLTLTSTSHATKGVINLIGAGTTVYDEANDRLGIGTASPTHKLHVVGNTIIDGNATITGSLNFSDIQVSSIEGNRTLRTQSNKKIVKCAAPKLLTLSSDIPLTNPEQEYTVFTFDMSDATTELDYWFLSASILIYKTYSGHAFDIYLRDTNGNVINRVRTPVIYAPVLNDLHTVYFQAYVSNYSSEMGNLTLSIKTPMAGDTVLHESSSGLDNRATTAIMNQIL